ncbi:UDP-sugar pyrophosphorylase 1 isoform X2 [Selaginella moellendorffii]|uniref:UDP-sugar pyrophosphorylase 1 isoform X2 n=1 Tax=Selaginella moellendorffii TaxID=88036 RepID=UPI000D1C2909|nr:UDP-sugar pyrophosphorylase 1 isoform X2 [Selaginella moellendorffii]|eukprot:XP_002973847.2 UDP-sugar pyrophosphorylase 1 isoform X2 [Selaginella moellendorffii]
MVLQAQWVLPRDCDAAMETLAQTLLDHGQEHLFEGWPEPGIGDDDKARFFNQVKKLDANYPGGLVAYIDNARKLLADSKAGRNPFDGYVPSVPSGERLYYGDERFVRFEEAGVKAASNAAFVLVAGGLGERLGYTGIKVALPSETTTGTCFLELYIKNILALQEFSSATRPIPFVIMTSDDTHAMTEKLLKENNFFGMDPSQVTLLKQEKVACLADNFARLARNPSDKYSIQTKPHGHGDVHAVLYSSGILSRWKLSGVKWLIFFQDTNGLLFKAIPASLGVSVTNDLDVNSLAVPRKAKEPIGGIARLTHTNGSEMVINVEYNQLDPLLRNTGYEDGDVNDETGYSPYPGNINQLVLKLDSYLEELTKTNGAIVEFVNPKYKDAGREEFKSSTRLECMMQDYPRTLSPSAKVGFTVMDTWLAYAPVKNNPEDAAKVPEGNPRHSATTGEMAIYKANSLILKKAGVKIGSPTIETFNGQEVEVWPRVVWSPSWGLTSSDVKRKISGSCEITQRSTLVIRGANVSFKDLYLDGALVIDASKHSEVEIHSIRVVNDGWEFQKVGSKDVSVPEQYRIRGFITKQLDHKELEFDLPGSYLIACDDTDELSGRRGEEANAFA